MPFTTCRSLTQNEQQYSYCAQVKPLYCHPDPCGIGPVYEPPIPPNMDFFAVSAFADAFDNIEAMHGGVYDADGFVIPGGVLEASRKICSLVSELDTIELNRKFVEV